LPFLFLGPGKLELIALPQAVSLDIPGQHEYVGEVMPKWRQQKRVSRGGGIATT